MDCLYQIAHDFKAGQPTCWSTALGQGNLAPYVHLHVHIFTYTQSLSCLQFYSFIGLIGGVQPAIVHKKNPAMCTLTAQQAAVAEDEEELDEMPDTSLLKRETTINVSTSEVDIPATNGLSTNPTSQYSDEEHQHHCKQFREVWLVEHQHLQQLESTKAITR